MLRLTFIDIDLNCNCSSWYTEQPKTTSVCFILCQGQSKNLKFEVLGRCLGDENRAKSLYNSYSIFKFTPTHEQLHFHCNYIFSANAFQSNMISSVFSYYSSLIQYIFSKIAFAMKVHFQYECISSASSFFTAKRFAMQSFFLFM